MVCYGILWYVMVYYGILWYIMVCYGILWYIIVCYGILWYIMVCYGMLWYIMGYYGILRYIWLGVLGFGFWGFRVLGIHKASKRMREGGHLRNYIVNVSRNSLSLVHGPLGSRLLAWD